MGLLDGGLQAVFGAALGAIFLSGTLHKITLIDDAEGGWASTETAHPVKSMMDACTEQMRGAAGYTERSVRLIVLQAGVPVAPNSDDQITLSGARWAISMIEEDPARGAWVMMGTPA